MNHVTIQIRSITIPNEIPTNFYFYSGGRIGRITSRSSPLPAEISPGSLIGIKKSPPGKGDHRTTSVAATIHWHGDTLTDPRVL